MRAPFASPPPMPQVSGIEALGGTEAKGARIESSLYYCIVWTCEQLIHGVVKINGKVQTMV